MLNAKNERELAYVVIVDKILPIKDADNVEQAVVGGWHILVRKDQFHSGDPAIYFEIDSKVPETEPFKFLEAKHYKIKTQKYFKGTVISQGLLMSAEDFGWKINYDTQDSSGDIPYICDNENEHHYAEGESRFLTEKLGVKYSVDEDNIRKASSGDKYKKMAQRNGKLFSHQPFRWLMKRTWGKKFLFIFFGKKKDKNNWPLWVVKTDEERVQNMPWILESKQEWIATEKIDGTSTTFTIKRAKGFFNKNKFYVCSRNVVFDTPNKNCYYDTNVYTEMAEKYKIEEILNKMLKEYPQADWITIQGETYGADIQKRNYSMKNHDFMAFNLIMSNTGKWNTIKMAEELKKYGIPSVPIIDSHFTLPNTVEELLNYATNKSVIDGGMREGIVFRSKDGTQSFKAVSNDFLLKYHQ